MTNGITYEYQVRAVNDVGNGAVSSVSATPSTTPGAPVNLTTDRPEIDSVRISWEAAPDNGSSVFRYQYRRRAGTTGSWKGWYTVTGGGDARSRTVTGLRHLVRYYWELRAENGNGFGPSASVTTEPQGLRGSGEPESELDNIGSNEGEPDTPMDDEVAGKPVAVSTSDDGRVVFMAPNPFNADVEISFLLLKDEPVRLTIHNTAGQLVATLEDGQSFGAGIHTRYWHGIDQNGYEAASGVYLFRLVTGQEVYLGKLALIR